jgi:Ca2+-binding RTX toxin-like protein
MSRGRLGIAAVVIALVGALVVTAVPAMAQDALICRKRDKQGDKSGGKVNLGGGNDYYNGGEGNDKIYGGPGDDILNSPADTKGLELEAARAYFLVDASGTLSRGSGWDYERDVQIIDTSAMNGAGSYQINLSTGAGTNMYFSRVSETGDVLELDEGTSGKKVVYKRVP